MSKVFYLLQICIGRLYEDHSIDRYYDMSKVKANILSYQKHTASAENTYSFVHFTKHTVDMETGVDVVETLWKYKKEFKPIKELNVPIPENQRPNLSSWTKYYNDNGILKTNPNYVPQ